MSAKQLWTLTRKAALKEIWESELTTEECAPEINRRFGTSFSPTAVAVAAGKLGVLRPAAIKSAHGKKAGSAPRHPRGMLTKPEWTPEVVRTRQRDEPKVNRVAPGTYPAPVGGFSMLRAREIDSPQ